MDRPNLPYAISAVPASELPFAAFDSTAFGSRIDDLLAAFDRADVATVEAPAAVDQPISAWAHVNRARLVPFRSRLLETA